MTTDALNWLVASNALDHRATISALSAAVLPAVTSEEGITVEDLATTIAEGLGRAGLVLVPVAETTAEQVGQIGEALREQADTSWFGRKED